VIRHLPVPIPVGGVAGGPNVRACSGVCGGGRPAFPLHCDAEGQDRRRRYRRRTGNDAEDMTPTSPTKEAGTGLDQPARSTIVVVMWLLVNLLTQLPTYTDCNCTQLIKCFGFSSFASAFEHDYTLSYISASAFGRLLQLSVQTTHFRIESAWSIASAFDPFYRFAYRNLLWLLVACFSFRSILHIVV
jgi:hypothetical protein